MNKNNLRTVEQLNDFLQRELAWRRKELNLLSKLINSRSDASPAYRDMLLRAGITVLYAHWEGFIKTSATSYVCFVSMQKLKYKELAPNFLALSMKNKMNTAIESSVHILHRQIIDFFLSELETRSHLGWETAIQTEANLSSKVFKNIIDLLGLEYLPNYETRQNVIDEQLLKSRNEASHGEGYLELDELKLIELYSIFLGDSDNLGILDQFSDQIVNAALQKKYMASI